jgi:23S rRNA (guanine2069-N7)-methyltransferase / 23S rRNA (guanine2445-N2)-methyltransferase
VGLSFFATVPPGMESLLAGELRGLSADHVRQARAGVSFEGTLETACRVCLWSRLASRVLLTLVIGPAGDADALYATVQRVDWDEHMDVGGTLAVDFTGTSGEIRDTRYGTVRVKDAIVDQFRERHGGRRPSVDSSSPDLRVNAHLAGGRVTVSVDLSGESLHRRSYRADKVQVEAPLKENLAAAVLLFAAWPQEAAAGGSFLDPLCGSGTLPIEAAWIAADVAPGLLRTEGRPRTRGAAATASPRAAGRGFGLTRWKGRDDGLWAGVVGEARERREAGLGRLKAAAPGLVIRGADRDPRAVEVAGACVARAGLGDVVAIERAALERALPPAAHGLVATNAPYGERLGGRKESEVVCRELGRTLRSAFTGWHAAVLAGNPDQQHAIGLRPSRETTLRNGTLDCTLAYYDVAGGDTARGWSSERLAARSAVRHGQFDGEGSPGPYDIASDELARRLRRNLGHVGRTMRRQGVTCYRLYDADLPQFNLAVDVYEGRLHVQEYAPPAEIPAAKAAANLAEAIRVIATTLEVRSRDIVVKQRRRQRGAAQYERRAAGSAPQRVTEDGLAYLVDLERYIDTGLFLDQRETRRLIRGLAGGRRFLNLFAYTGAATICAVAGGASTTTSVDLSATYLDWARRNLAENGITDVSMELARERPAAARPAGRRGGVPPSAGPRPGSAHRLIQADCLSWISTAEGQYDLILLDPPTFSNSKRMGGATFDVQRDHADLIRMTARRLLAPRGVLLFCSNRRGFVLDPAALPGLAAKDLSRATLAPDFARRAAFHHVWRLQRH